MMYSISVRCTSIFNNFILLFDLLDWNELGRKLPYYGRVLDPSSEADIPIIEAQLASGNKPHPVEEDFVVFRRDTLQSMKDLLRFILDGKMKVDTVSVVSHFLLMFRVIPSPCRPTLTAPGRT